jgi:hypothetical protein
MYTCRFLARNNQASTRSIDRGANIEDLFNIDDIDGRLKAQTIDRGLRLILGFATRATMVGQLGADVARMLPRTSIARSWFDSNDAWQPVDNRTEGDLWRGKSLAEPDNLAIAYGSATCMSDYVPSPGSAFPSEASGGTDALYRFCDEGAALDNVPQQTMGAISIVERPSPYVIQRGSGAVELKFECNRGSDSSRALFGDDSQFPLICEARRTDAPDSSGGIDLSITYLGPDDGEGISKNNVLVTFPSDLPVGDYEVRFIFTKEMTFGYFAGTVEVVEAP